MSAGRIERVIAVVETYAVEARDVRSHLGIALNDMGFTFREVLPQEEKILWRMLYEAAHLSDEGFSSTEAAMGIAGLKKYAENWGKPGDLGFAAFVVDGSEPVGAAWIRLLNGPEKGYGYLNDFTPEMAIGVLPRHQNKGIGTELMRLLIETASRHYSSISLGVRANSPAVKLYKRFGFQIVEGTQHINRVGGQSFIMKLELNQNKI